MQSALALAAGRRSEGAPSVPPAVLPGRRSEGAPSVPSAVLPGTGALTWDGDISVRMMDQAHVFMERLIAESPARRSAYRARNFSSAEAYAQSVEPNRDRLRRIIGVTSQRVPVVMHRDGDRARWSVLEGVTGEGLLIEPAEAALACVIVIPDLEQSPEQMTGIASALARAGCRVAIPALIRVRREWIYRQAFHMGRHIIGYEVQKVLALVDFFSQEPGAAVRVGVLGAGEGGLLALYAAALDQRITAALVSGYFDAREQLWREPLYRNVWGLLREFGDAEIGSLVAPRSLIVEATGERNAQSARAEFDRMTAFASSAFPFAHFFQSTAAVEPAALNAFAGPLGLPRIGPVAEVPASVDAERQKRQAEELENDVQKLVRDSDRVRNQFFLYQVAPDLADTKWNTRIGSPALPVERVTAHFPRYRDYFWNEVMGRIEEPVLPPNPRTRLIREQPLWSGYEVVLDVWRGVFAWGVLLVPKDLKPGERRPAVVCQHGRNGVPLDVIEGDVPFYHDFARHLAEQGFVVFAPHIPFRNEPRYRSLWRKAQSIKASLFSIVAGQNQQTLQWLGTLPFIDAARIGFYGLSFGGETAMRIPSLLPGYALSVCSADFNNWTRKVAATDQPWSFMYSDEWETGSFNMGNTFDHAELACLMAPRPFMVERGHADQVGRDEWVAFEYAKVQRFYSRLGIPGDTEIEYFEGGHTIHGKGTFRFLNRHLRWPPRG